MQKRPTTIATANHKPVKLNQAYVGLWASVVSTAVNDLKYGKSGSARAFFNSDHFKTVASLCGIDYDSAMLALAPYLQKPADAPECPVQAAPVVDEATDPPKPKKRLHYDTAHKDRKRVNNRMDFELATVGDSI